MRPVAALDVLRCRLDGTTLIEASAGTGKTWAICALVLRLLLERGLDVGQILVVTFTNAATAELRERIRSRIAQTLARLRGSGPGGEDRFVDELLASLRAQHRLDDGQIERRLDLALQSFDQAAIFTIHGFCQRALADTAFAAALPPALELLADDAELRLQVVNDHWRREIAGADLPPALAAHLLARRDRPEAWAKLLARAVAKPLSRTLWPEGTDAEAPIDVGALAAAHAAARRTWQAERAAIVDIVTAALPRLNARSYKPEAVRTAAEQWDRLLAVDDPLAAPAGLDKLGLFTAAKLEPKKGQAPVEPHAFFAQAEALLAARAATDDALGRRRLRLLRRLLDAGPPALRALKRERRVVGFDDMLYLLYERLAGGDRDGLAAALRGRFPAALIDEFQDTDPLQHAIFDAIYRDSGAPVFLVGDPKQAIYGFRQADLHTYLRARDAAAVRYTLADNQRSVAPLLQALNALFAANPQAFVLPGLDYHPVRLGEKRRPSWADRSLPRAPLQLWALPGSAQGEPAPKADARAAAAVACAGEVARLLAAAQRGEVVHAGRPLAGGDIAILVRSHAQGALMRRELAALGVASVELARTSIFETPDAEDLERVLAAIVDPARPRRVRAALATDLLGHDAAAVEAISADEPRLLAIVTRFAGYRAQWLERGIGVMLRLLLAGEGVTARMLARADGERRLTNLRHLAECLHDAAQTHPAPEQLLRWLQNRRTEFGGDEALQLRLESDRHLVQIVTIHRAKGLEYPVVLCPFAWDGHPGGPGERIEGREYHDDDGLPVIDFGLADDPEVAARVVQERAAENLRLLYVALTRAVQRCILVVGVYATRNGSIAEAGRSPLHWLVAGAGRSLPEWLRSAPTAAQLAAAWQDFAAANPAAVGLAELPAGPWAAVEPARVAPDAIAALPPPGQIAPAWWIGSYTGLTQGARHDAAAADHDTRVAASPAVEDTAAAGVAADDILRFPRGTAAGTCLHAVFECADFTDPAGWPAAIAAALRGANAASMAGLPEERLERMLARMLGDVLHTPLGAGLELARIPRSRRLVELEFHLAAPRLRADALRALLRAHGFPVPALDFGVLQGFLRGFIDLVVEHRGRFLIVDWKSNHLGWTRADYAPASLAQAMREHGYHLQALLYALALHRWLSRRLPGYRFDDHFGGAIYLFVRGVRPDWTDAAGEPLGVQRVLPSRALIEQLATLLGEDSP
jgi:exodeoxyribonuclease V beta subunit